MESPLSAYSNSKNKDKLRKESYPMFEKKYVSNPYKEYDFLETEERYLAQKLKFFIPGRIYTYQYDPIYKDILSYYDKRPIILVHGQFISKGGRPIVQGVNLNFLPELARVQTLEIFYKNFKEDILSAEKMIDKNQIGIFQKVWKVLTNWLSTVKIFEIGGGVCYEYAYRSYALERIKNPVLIELEDWNTIIPYIQPKEFQGASPADVWKQYLTALQNSKKRGLPDEKKAQASQKKFKP